MVSPFQGRVGRTLFTQGGASLCPGLICLAPLGRYGEAGIGCPNGAKTNQPRAEPSPGLSGRSAALGT